MGLLFWKGTRLTELVRALRDELLATPGAPLPPALQELVELVRARGIQPSEPGTPAPAAPEAPRGPSPFELLNAIPDAAGIVHGNGKVMLANQALDVLAGGSALGRTPLELTRSAELAEAVRTALDGTPARLEVVLPSQQRTVLAHLTPLSQQGALMLLRDLTESKRIEAARRDFVANASHELRTPVAAISAATETLLGGAITMPPEAKHFLEMIARHAARLTRLTQDLLDLSKLESGDWKLELSPLEVRPIARYSVDAVRTRADDKRIVLDCRVAEGLRAVCDRRALEQVLVNLLDNGVKYTPAGGSVHVDAAREGSWLVLSVVDTGPGIEARHLSRVFERFYRVDSGRSRDTGGTGLGLAIVKHLVQAQGGDVGVESSPKGTRFWVRLQAA